MDIFSRTTSMKARSNRRTNGFITQYNSCHTCPTACRTQERYRIMDTRHMISVFVPNQVPNSNVYFMSNDSNNRNGPWVKRRGFSCTRMASAGRQNAASPKKPSQVGYIAKWYTDFKFHIFLHTPLLTKFRQCVLLQGLCQRQQKMSHCCC